MKIRFTKAAIDGLKPKANPFYVQDSGQAGLVLVVNPSGLKSFRLIAKRDGSQIKKKIGNFPEMTIDAARDEVRRRLTEVVTNGSASHITFGALFKLRLESVKAKKKTWLEDERKFDKHLSRWKDKPIGRITESDVRELFDEVSRTISDVTANRVLSLIKATFEFGVPKYLKDNPAKRIGKHPESNRERFLTENELPSFLQALNAEDSDDYRDIFQILLFTGARKSNVCEMQWSEIDLTHGIWLIAGKDAKGKKQLAIPLVGPAMEILSARHGKLGNLSPWVFPAPHNRTGHITELRKPWTRVINRAGIEDLHIHDLRHSLASWQAILGSSLQVIGKSLGHADTRTTERYAHLGLAPVRKSMEAAVKAMRGS